jgi:4-hydroxy-3-polyprenylbenzoate decarboxylase
MPIPKGVDEAGYVGALLGEPLELVRCRTIDLDVPASAEIVIEGLLSPDEKTDEGPFGEYHGYLMGSSHPQPVCHITAITHRDDAILPIVPAGKPVDDDHTLVGLGGGAEFLHRLRAAGLPVRSAVLVPETAVHLGVVTVARDWRTSTGIESSQELCRRIGEALLETKNHVWMSRLMVLDEDIDPSDLRDVTWGFATRSHPVAGQVTIPERLASPLTPAYTPAERAKVKGPLAIHDCLLPEGEQRPRISSFDEIYPEAVRRRVLEL